MTRRIRRVLQASLLVDAHAAVGEAPLWDAQARHLVWVDIPPGRIYVSSDTGQILHTFDLGRPVGAALPASTGGWLLADSIGFTRLGVDGTTTTLLEVFSRSPGVRFNDAKCDPAGRAWAGSMAYDMTPGAGALYRLDAGPRATAVLEGRTVSNGLGWSPDARTMWFADSADRFIAGYEYDVSDGTLGRRRAAIELQQTPGKADGLCVDDEGCIWIGLWGGAAVHRYTPEGRLDTIVQVPVGKVTSCAFGGPRGSTLFITTASVDMGPDELAREPHAGGLFVVEPGVSGPSATPWRLHPD